MQVKDKKRSWIDVFLCKPAEQTVDYYNPLNVKPGVVITLNLPDYTSKEWTLRRIAEYTRTILDKQYVSTNYELAYQDVKTGTMEKIRLMVVPNPTAHKNDADKYSVVLLKFFYEGKYDELKDKLKDADQNGVWVIDDDGLDDNGVKISEPYHDEFKRCGGLNEPCEAAVAAVEDMDDDGVLRPDRIEKSRIEYRDFEREVEDAPGATSTELFFVETSEEDGWVTMWKGDRIDPSVVTAL